MSVSMFLSSINLMASRKQSIIHLTSTINLMELDDCSMTFTRETFSLHYSPVTCVGTSLNFCWLGWVCKHKVLQFEVTVVKDLQFEVLNQSFAGKVSPKEGPQKLRHGKIPVLWWTTTI